jgi:UDP-2,3-diacylglucosamine pyrophosphatase LpxH
MNRTKHKTVILSDIHLGTSHSKSRELCQFLKSISCKKLILNGDIIDGWYLQKKNGKKNVWKKKHTEFFKVIIKMMEKDGTEIIYIRGNHDDFLDSIAPFRFANIRILNYYILRSKDKKYFVTHGDVFDKITTGIRWLAKIGDIGYSLLLRLNKYVNEKRMKRGQPYYSLSQKIKHQVKQAVAYISDYEHQLVQFAWSKKMDGIICGHIHHPANKMMQGIHYLNSGDWVESLTALTEDFEGNWEIYYYDKNLIKLDEE